MPDDPNDLSQDPEPFDLSAMMPPSVAPATAGQARPAPHLPQHAKPGRGGIAAQAALAAIVPLIAKRGGPLAVSALLQGFQHAQAGQAQVSNQQAQQDFENQRQLDADQRAVATQQANEQYRQQALEQQRRTQATAIVKDFATKLSAAETKEQVEGLSQAFRYAARVVGLRPEAVEGLIAKAAPTPATTVERQVRKVVGGLTPEQVDQYLQGGLSITIPGQKLPVPVDVWSQYIVAGVDPVSGKRTVAVKKPDVPNTPEEQFYQQYAVEHGAKSFGALPTATQAQARKMWMQSDDRPAPPREEPLVRVETTDADGNVVVQFVPKSQAAGKTYVKPGAKEKEPTQPQFQSGAFAGRMEQAEQVLGTVDKTVAGMNLLSYAAQARSPAALQSSTFQSYDQAARNFINAVLRRESGAAISPSEFDSARKQYLPQPGDTETTLAQKRANREYVFQTMKKSAGRAYEAPPPAPLTSDAQVGRVYLYNGKKIRIREKTRTGFLWDEVTE